MGGARFRKESFGGSVKYQTSLIFSQLIEQSWETISTIADTVNKDHGISF